MSMRKGLAVFALVGLGFAAGRLVPTQPSKALAAEQPEMDAAMALMQPGDAHKVLECFMGTWEGDVKFWMAPGTEPMTSHGTLTREWAMDGRFIIEHVDATSDMGPFKGMGIVGYNTVDKKYESFWIESMATWMTFATGTYDAAKKTFTFTGDMIDPMTMKRTKARSVIDCSNPTRTVMSGFTAGPDGKEFKNFEGDFARKD